jgi:hypothetical protein
MNNSSLQPDSNPSLKTERFFMRLKMGIWSLGVATWLIGIGERSIAAFSDRHLSAIGLIQLVTIFGFFVGWLFLKPADNIFKWYYPTRETGKIPIPQDDGQDARSTPTITGFNS